MNKNLLTNLILTFYIIEMLIEMQIAAFATCWTGYESLVHLGV